MHDQYVHPTTVAGIKKQAASVGIPVRSVTVALAPTMSMDETSRLVARPYCFCRSSRVFERDIMKFTYKKHPCQMQDCTPADIDDFEESKEKADQLCLPVTSSEIIHV